MQKQKVFIPVNIEDELPEMDKKVIVFGEQLSSNPQMGGKYPFVTKRQDLSKSHMRPDRLQDDNKFMYARYVSDWLKEQEGYFFTAEELKILESKLDSIDETLSYFEDWMHGEDGKEVTAARKVILEIKNFKKE